jgi:hypothetical protein
VRVAATPWSTWPFNSLGHSCNQALACRALISSPTASSKAVVPLAWSNLGLTTAEAESIQYFLISRGHDPGPVDGKLGLASWKAMQRYLHDCGYRYTGSIDGEIGPSKIRALQRRLADAG